MKNCISYCIVFSILPFILSGCAYESRAFDAEQITLASTLADEHRFTLGERSNRASNAVLSTTVLYNKPPTYSAFYALQLSDAYKRLGDDAARNRDILAGGLITVAGGAALGSAASISGKDLALVLAGGALINEGIKYVNPNSAAQAFYIASESMACASTAIASFYPETSQPDIKVTSVALWYIRKIEILLRTALKRNVPDWKGLLASLNVPSGAVPVVAGTLDEGSRVNALEAALKDCLRPPAQDEDSDDQD